MPAADVLPVQPVQLITTSQAVAVPDSALIQTLDSGSNQPPIKPKFKHGGKRPGAGRKPISREKAAAIVASAALGATIMSNARTSETSTGSVQRYSAALASEFPHVREALAGDAISLAKSAFEQVHRRLPDANALQAATIAGITIDKHMVLTGQTDNRNGSGPILTQNKLELHVHQAPAASDPKQDAKSLALLQLSGLAKQ